VEHYVPLTLELTAANQVSLDPVVKVNSVWAGKSVEELNSMKEAYKRDLNPSGEVPTVVTAKGEAIFESEISAEFMDAIGDPAGPKLVPEDPVEMAKMRLAMKRFGDTLGPCYQLLTNQDPTKDQELIAGIKTSMDKWASSLSQTGPYCLGERLSLADIHVAPFLHRLQIALQYWRGFDLLQGQARAAEIAAAVKALPAWSGTDLSQEQWELVYEGYANQLKAEDGKWAGRGKSSL